MSAAAPPEGAHSALSGGSAAASNAASVGAQQRAADLRDEYDVVVVGAGPAGLAAATSCARAGLSTVLFDEQASPGGQIYRSITDTPVTNESLLGPDYWKGARLATAFAK